MNETSPNERNFDGGNDDWKMEGIGGYDGEEKVGVLCVGPTGDPVEVEQSKRVRCRDGKLHYHCADERGRNGMGSGTI